MLLGTNHDSKLPYWENRAKARFLLDIWFSQKVSTFIFKWASANQLVRFLSKLKKFIFGLFWTQLTRDDLFFFKNQSIKPKYKKNKFKQIISRNILRWNIEQLDWIKAFWGYNSFHRKLEENSFIFKKKSEYVKTSKNIFFETFSGIVGFSWAIKTFFKKSSPLHLLNLWIHVEN